MINAQPSDVKSVAHLLCTLAALSAYVKCIDIGALRTHSLTHLALAHLRHCDHNQMSCTRVLTPADMRQVSERYRAHRPFKQCDAARVTIRAW
jgi:hypothetical protein